ncbi:MAG TPA: hypothetical protein VLB27_04160 [candidate division Zixibacteria bacterium]|nr:hypothetical protein [candidate division Zixibacteria bacterium]
MAIQRLTTAKTISRAIRAGWTAAIVAALAGWTGAAASEPISATAELDRDRIAFDQPLVLTCTVEWRADLVTPEPSVAPTPELKRLHAQSVSTRTAQVDRDGTPFVRREYRYKLTATADGLGVVGPLTFAFMRLADSSSVSVSTAEVSAQIAAPLPVSGGAGNAPLWFGALALLALIGAVVFWLLKRKPAAVDEPQDELSRRLAQLKALTAQPRAKFYTALYEFLCDGARERGLISGRAGDSAVVVRQLEATPIAGEERAKLIHWLELSAREKFAPGRGTPGDTLRLYYEVESFARENWAGAAQSEVSAAERR